MASAALENYGNAAQPPLRQVQTKQNRRSNLLLPRLGQSANGKHKWRKR